MSMGSDGSNDCRWCDTDRGDLWYSIGRSTHNVLEEPMTVKSKYQIKSRSKVQTAPLYQVYAGMTLERYWKFGQMIDAAYDQVGPIREDEDWEQHLARVDEVFQKNCRRAASKAGWYARQKQNRNKRKGK